MDFGLRILDFGLKKRVWWGTAVLLIAALLRLALLADTPPGLAQDEVLNADIVTFIRQGKNALFFREGYGHEPLYHYWAVPFQVLLGDHVLSIRLPAVYLGMLLAALTMRWVGQEFGDGAAVITGLGIATSWWPIIFSRIGLRPILEPVLLLLAALAWKRKPWLAGLWLGLSLYSYTAARVVFLIPALLILSSWACFHKQEEKERWRTVQQSAIVLFVSLLVYLPLALTLRADPTLQQRVAQLSGPLDALQQGNFRPLLGTTAATLKWFTFQGDPRWTYSLPGRPLLNPLYSLFFYGGLALAFWRFRQPKYQLPLIWFWVTLIPSAITPQAPSAVRLIGAIPVLYLFPALAAVELTKNVKRRHLKTSIWIVVGLALLINLGRTVSDGFIRWPAAFETRIKYQTVLQEIARYAQADPGGPLVITDGFYEPIDHDSFRRNVGSNTSERWAQASPGLAGAMVLPAGGGGRLIVPEYAPPPPELFTAAGISSQPLLRRQGAPGFAVYLLPGDLPEAMSELATFDERITLLRAEFSPVTPGQPLQMFTWWRVEADLPADLAIFMHLLDVDGRLASQHDGLDAAPDRLQPGDVIIQRHLLPWPQQPEQKFSLRVGVYTRGDGRRFLTAAPAGAADQVILRTDWTLTKSR